VGLFVDDLYRDPAAVAAMFPYRSTAGSRAGSLPAYLASAPVPATGKSFDVPHYTIAHWPDGKITYLKVMADVCAILGQLGLA
jgi:hypothetical protein